LLPGGAFVRHFVQTENVFGLLGADKPLGLPDFDLTKEPGTLELGKRAFVHDGPPLRQQTRVGASE
jgi:hypothetical protein